MKRVFLFFKIIVIGFISIVLLQQKAASQTLTPDKLLTQFVMRSWSSEEGLPADAATGILQGNDGYIWIGTYAGLVRFDGSEFTVYGNKSMDSPAIQAIAEDKDSAIWVATQKGVYRYKNNKVERDSLLEPLNSLNTEVLFIDSHNSIWIGTNSAGLFKYNHSELQHIEGNNELHNSVISLIYEDKDGAIWIGTDGGNLLRYESGKFESWSVPQLTGGITSMHNDERGNLWLGCTSGCFQITADSLLYFKPLGEKLVYHIISDTYGLWFATVEGLYRYNTAKDKLEMLNQESGLPNDIVRHLTFDKWGNLWGATYRKGVFLLSDEQFLCFSVQEGLASEMVVSVVQVNDSTFWLGNENGVINILTGNELTTKRIEKMPDARLKRLFRDSYGNIWVATYGGLLKISETKTTLYNSSSGFPDELIRSVFEDSEGQIWVGTRTSGLHRLNADGSVFTINKETGLGADYIMDITEDNRQRLLVSSKNGLNIIENDSVIQHYTVEDGLISNLIFNIYVDENNVYWIATNSGISRFENGEFFNYSIDNGLIDNVVFDIIPDNHGYFWMPGNRGIMRIYINDLNLFAKGTIYSYDVEVFNEGDGMRSRQSIGASEAFHSSDGRLWFLTSEGIAIIDPDIESKGHKPTMLIERITADDSLYYLDQTIRIPPETRRIQIKYTSFEFIAPQNIHFEYRLLPFEKEWVEVVNERIAPYTNLEPGKYTFQLRATNKEGDWNENYTSISFYLQPYWWQTVWFKIGVALLLITTVFVWYRIRVYSIKKRNRLLEQQVKERTSEIREKNHKLEQQKDEIHAQAEYLSEANKEIMRQKEALEISNQQITESITYARRIQNAVLPLEEIIGEVLPRHFIIWKPRDIVSGDFYWFNVYRHYVVVAAADCTGHGVPGAFMSMLGIAFLNEIVSKKTIETPGEMLDKLREKVKTALRQTGRDDEQKDGMDISLCMIDLDSNELQYAGAHNPLLIIRDKQLEAPQIKKMKVEKKEDYTLYQLKASPQPIGVFRKEKAFDNHNITLYKNDMLYLFSDGFPDQTGGSDGRKFMTKHFKQFLFEIHHLPVQEQKQALENKLTDWMGNYPQVDDILVIGIKI